ncbi:hypothetical protein D770_08450 [Flammeovirgaceae bacterium 311]|nr:hypothetical protein D770_08450 [Flammeovirgaceae bacterium 311]
MLVRFETSKTSGLQEYKLLEGRRFFSFVPVYLEQSIKIESYLAFKGVANNQLKSDCTGSAYSDLRVRRLLI